MISQSVGGWKFLVTEYIFSLRNVPGVFKKGSFGGGADFGLFGAPHTPMRGSRGVGKRYTSSYDHDL